MIGSVKLCKNVHFLFKVFYTIIKCAKGANSFSYIWGNIVNIRGTLKGGTLKWEGTISLFPQLETLFKVEKDSSITVISIHDGHFDRLFTLRFFFYCGKNILKQQIGQYEIFRSMLTVGGVQKLHRFFWLLRRCLRKTKLWLLVSLPNTAYIIAMSTLQC